MRTFTLSDAAVALFGSHVERQGDIDVDELNRELYRELEATGLVLLGRPFVREPRCHLARMGFERKLELFDCAAVRAL